jgi:hypothetical protein
VSIDSTSRGAEEASPLRGEHGMHDIQGFLCFTTCPPRPVSTPGTHSPSVSIRRVKSREERRFTLALGSTTFRYEQFMFRLLGWLT